MTAALRIAAALMAGTVLVLGLPIGAVAADDKVVPSRLTVGGKPLAALVRTEPTAPFIAYESGYVSVGIQADDTERADNEDEQPRSMRKSVLIGAGIGAGAGLAMGGTTCWNEGGGFCGYAGIGALAGFGVGAGIGALVGVLTGR